MLFDNPSEFTLRKMRELIGKKMCSDDMYGKVARVEYSQNVFDVIYGFTVYVDFERGPANNPIRTDVLYYPEDFELHLDLSKCELSNEFLLDIKQALERIKTLDKESNENLKRIATIPLEERITKQHNNLLPHDILYKLHVRISPAFILGCSALFEIGRNYGNVCLELFSWDIKESPISKFTRRLLPSDIAELNEIYRKFDFLTHTRKKEKIGLDGVSLHCDYYDGEAYRHYYCWCPDENEIEFELVRLLFRYLRECFPGVGAQQELDDIREYFDCSELF